MPNIIELRPDKGLMDPNFEKYQFIDDPIQILEKDLEKGKQITFAYSNQF